MPSEACSLIRCALIQEYQLIHCVFGYSRVIEGPKITAGFERLLLHYLARLTTLRQDLHYTPAAHPNVELIPYSQRNFI